MSLIKSRKRVADHGEVFTPAWLVEAMLDLVKDEADRIDSRFLEPACGSGNFLIPVLRRKLAAVEARYGRSGFDKRNFTLVALMSIYGVDLLADNVAECRENLLTVTMDYLGVDQTAQVSCAAAFILAQNIVQGDADGKGPSYHLCRMGLSGKGKFQRRDFRLDALASASEFTMGATLFAQLGNHEIFTPVKVWPILTVGDLAKGADLPTKEGT